MDFEWHEAQDSLFWPAVNFFPPRIICKSCGIVPVGACRQTRNVVIGRAMAGLAIDTGLSPGRMIGIGFKIIIRGVLAHMAPVTRRIEGVWPFAPMDARLCTCRGMCRMPLAAVSNHSFFFTSYAKGNVCSRPLFDGVKK